MRKWETDLAGCYRSIASICKRLGISPDEAAKLDSIAEKYPVCIPEYYLGLIDPGDPEDPIRKMAVPSELNSRKAAQKILQVKLIILSYLECSINTAILS